VTNAKQRFVLFYGFDPSPIRPTYQKKGSARKVDMSGATEVPLVALEDREAIPTYDSELPGSVSDPPLRTIELSEGQNPPPGVQAEYFIRAAQGHSLPTVTTEHLEPVLNDEAGRRMVGEMVHGTKEELWDVIRKSSHMYRVLGAPKLIFTLGRMGLRDCRRTRTIENVETTHSSHHGKRGREVW
jgi:2'-phosphotransferase